MSGPHIRFDLPVHRGFEFEHGTPQVQRTTENTPSHACILELLLYPACRLFEFPVRWEDGDEVLKKCRGFGGYLSLNPIVLMMP